MTFCCVAVRNDAARTQVGQLPSMTTAAYKGPSVMSQNNQNSQGGQQNQQGDKSGQQGQNPNQKPGQQSQNPNQDKPGQGGQQQGNR